MSETVVYRCGGCRTEFHVGGEVHPTVLCPDCNVVASRRGDADAVAAYRVAYAHYREGRRQLAAGLSAFDEHDWTHARSLFTGAATAFDTAVEEFTEAETRAEAASLAEMTGTARQKATAFWQIVEWLGGTAFARKNDNAERAERFLSEAKQQFQPVSDLGDLTEPDALAADVLGEESATSEGDAESSGHETATEDAPVVKQPPSS
jgi:hypothetical protein